MASNVNAAVVSGPPPAVRQALTPAEIAEQQRRILQGARPPFNRGARSFQYAKGRSNRHIPGQMNKTEERYNAHLERRLKADEILQFGFEEITLKLAKDLRYTADFWVQKLDGVIEFHEVKGSKKHTVKDASGVKVKTGAIVPYFSGEDAKPKLRIAAEKFPFRFVVVFEDKAGGRWLTEEYSEPEVKPATPEPATAGLFG